MNWRNTLWGELTRLGAGSSGWVAGGGGVGAFMKIGGTGGGTEVEVSRDRVWFCGG